MGSFYKEFAWIFFTWKSFVKFFPNLKLEIEFHSHKKVVSPKHENSAHSFIVNFTCAKFQQNQRTFFFTWKSFVKFFPTFKLEIEFYSHKKVVSPKIENCAHLYIVKYNWANFQGNQRTFLDHFTRKQVNLHGISF